MSGVHPGRGTARRRRRPEEARREILDAAEDLLARGGPDAVTVQAVARAVGVSDAAVHYHFAGRDGLHDALVRNVGRRLAADLAAVIDAWDAGDADLGALLSQLDHAYGEQGYARLTAWMLLAGWRPPGSGMFRPHAEALHQARVRRAEAAGAPAPSVEDSLHLVALLNILAWAEPLVGAAWRRSVDLPGTDEGAARFRSWLVDLLQRHTAPTPG